MFSFYYETREDPHYQKLKAQVRKVFDMIKEGKFEPYTSLYATGEIDDEPELEKRERMAALIADYRVKFLEDTPEVNRLAALYIKEGAVPAASKTDAAHIAITAITGLDFIVTSCAFALPLFFYRNLRYSEARRNLWQILLIKMKVLLHTGTIRHGN